MVFRGSALTRSLGTSELLHPIATMFMKRTLTVAVMPRKREKLSLFGLLTRCPFAVALRDMCASSSCTLFRPWQSSTVQAVVSSRMKFRKMGPLARDGVGVVGRTWVGMRADVGLKIPLVGVLC